MTPRLTIRRSPTVAPLLVAALLCAIAHLGGRPAWAEEKSPAADARDAAGRGVNSYLAGKYADALPDLEKARDGGTATGAMLYMLGYCYEAVRHDAAASAKAYADSQSALEAEMNAEHPSLETYFYLSNLKLNRQDPEASKAVATQGVAAIDAHKLKVGKDGTSLFRAGKLYADAGMPERAAELHRKAVLAFSKETAPPPEYLRRAFETVTRSDSAKLDPAVAADTWKRLLDQNPSIPNGSWNYGLACMRAGRFEEAKAAFDAVRGGGSDAAQDAFYAWSLASGAVEITKSGVKLPTKSLDRKPLVTLDAAALDTEIAARAKTGSELLAAPVASQELEIRKSEDGYIRVFPGKKLSRAIDEAHAAFLAPVIELTARGESIQAKAFQGGYAPLVIKRWIQLWRANHKEQVDALSGGAPAPPAADPSSGTD